MKGVTDRPLTAAATATTRMIEMVNMHDDMLEISHVGMEDVYKMKFRPPMFAFKRGWGENQLWMMGFSTTHL